MTNQASAEIIPFPARVTAVESTEPVVSTPDAQERLARALARLDAALNEQRAAMAGWRDSLEQLRKATTGLGLSMQRYSRNLGKLGDDVAELNAGASRLERWADGAMRGAATQAGTPPRVQ